MNCKTFFIPCILMFCFAGFSTPLSESDVLAVVYRNPDPHSFGRDFRRQETIRYNLEDFRTTIYRRYEPGHLVPYLLSEDIYRGLKTIAEKTPDRLLREAQIRIDDAGIFHIQNTSAGIMVSFSCIRAPQELLDHIRLTYANSYWKDILVQQYLDKRVFVIHGGNDLNRNGRFSFSDALAFGSLLGDRNQPLWGLHDGSGFLNNIYYAIYEQDFFDPSGFYDYRPVTRNRDEFRQLLYNINTSGSSFPEAMLSKISPSVRRIFSPATKIKLPENLLSGNREGSELDFALAYFDLLKRSGHESHLLATQSRSIPLRQGYLVCFREPYTFSWHAIYEHEIFRDLSENLEDIPSLVYQQTVDFTVLDTDRIFATLKPPYIDSWSTSQF